MSTQLAHRLDELSQERMRLRESIGRIGQTFASNLDRRALLELALKTPLDAVQAQRDVGGESANRISVLSAALGPGGPEGGTNGVLTVARRSQPFSVDDRELVRSLASQATLALENVELHVQVSRQAVTDELTRSDHARHRRLQVDQ